MWTGPCGPRNCHQRYWPEFLRWQSSVLPPHCVPRLVRLPGEPNAIGGGTRSASAVSTPGGAGCARLCLPICRIKHILWEGMEMDKRSRCCTGWWLLEPTAQLCVDASIAGEAAPWPSRGQEMPLRCASRVGAPRPSPGRGPGRGAPGKRRSREEALPGRSAPARSPVPGAQALGSLCSRLQHRVRRDTGRAYYYDSSVTALAVLYHAW